MSYFINEYPYLVGYLENGKLNISNCGVENKIHPFAIGKKNWLIKVLEKLPHAETPEDYESLLPFQKKMIFRFRANLLV